MTVLMVSMTVVKVSMTDMSKVTMNPSNHDD